MPPKVQRMKLKRKQQGWKFGSVIPDREDIKAKISSYDEMKERFKEYLENNNMNEADEGHFIFNCGFFRGMDWMKYKIENKRVEIIE